MADRGTGLKSDDELLHRRRRTKNIAVGVVLFGLVVLFYLITIIKIGKNLT